MYSKLLNNWNFFTEQDNIVFLLQMFQVLHGEKPLYIQANNCVEASEWIEALCRVTRCNQKRLSFYHPSAFLNGSWLCCKATIENTVGCARCTA